MGTTRIKVIDLSSEQEQIKTSRKRAVKGLIGEIKRPLVEKKKVKAPEEPTATVTVSEAIQEKIGEYEILSKEEKEGKKEKKITRIKGRKYRQAKDQIANNQLYPIDEAIELLKKTSFVKFDASCEAHMILKQKGVSGWVSLPYGTGKKTKILVFAENGKPTKDAIWGNEETIEKIAKGELKPQKDFNKVYATPEFMPKLAKIAKILGPKGLMPNPKSGTVITDTQTTLKNLNQSRVEYKSEEKAPVIHTTFGKISFTKEELKANLLALTASVGLAKIKKLILSSTMGPGIKVNLSSLSAKKAD